MGYSEKTQQTTRKDTIGLPCLKHGGAGNRATALTAGKLRLRPACDLLDAAAARHGPKGRNITSDHALLYRRCRSIRWHYRHLLEEVPMATQRHGQIVETPTEARQAEPGPSVLALLTVSTGLAVLILGIAWFVFFRT
jgi:hypothetical protein